MSIVVGKTYKFPISEEIPELKLIYVPEEATDYVVIEVKKFIPSDFYVIDYHIDGWSGPFDFHKKHRIDKNSLTRMLKRANVLH